MRIRARRTPAAWLLDGTQLFVAGATGANFSVVAARTESEAGEPLGVSYSVLETDRPRFQR